MSHRGGVSRPMRAGGLALLGLAAVAAIIGTASAVSGSSEDDQAQRPPDEPGTSETSSPGGGGETSEPGESSEKPTATKPSKPTTTTTTEAKPGASSSAKPTGGQKPGGGTGGEKPGGGTGDAVKSMSVRVYNNSKIQGLANRAAEDLRANGWNVVSTGNYSGGTIYTTTAYYREGTSERDAAEAIAEQFGMRVEPRFDGIADSSPGVIVIVTKDYAAGK